MSEPPILLFFLLLLLVPSFISSQQQDDFIFTGFYDTTKINLTGKAELEGPGMLRLTNQTSRLLGHAFYPSPLRFKSSPNSSAVSSFSTSFAFASVPEFSTLGGHGFAFVLSPTRDLPGAFPSQYLGFLSPSHNGNFSNHIVAVEFDTVQDFEFGDINDNHIGIDLNDMTSNFSVPVAYYTPNGTKAPINLKGADTVIAWVDYDGAAKLLNVSVSLTSTKPERAILSYPVDLSPFLLDQMYAGFSASTGLLASSHYLFGWSFKINGKARPLDLSTLPHLPRPKKKHTTLIFAASTTSVALLIAAVAAAAYILYKIKTADIIEPWELYAGPHRFGYKELKRATRGFKEILGVGGFGKVYKGTLRSPRKDIAVKRVNHGSRQGLREFVAEIASIGRLRHRNLVQLQGWCRRRADLLLVYDYMPNGSLDKFLFAEDGLSPPLLLSWAQRFHVLRGVASALLYLHEEWEHVVIHRDVKASNVLLDAELNGRLGDFGLAKLYEHGANPSTTRVVGTLGYLAPELTRTGKSTTSTDVFAFGALALEVVCGRRPIEPKASPEELILVDYVWERWAAGNWAEAVDPRLGGDYNLAEAEVAVRVGLMCSHPAAAARPSMRDIVRFFAGGSAVAMPEVRSPPPADYEEVVAAGRVGFEDFVHSYPSSSFEMLSPPAAMPVEECEPAGPRDGGPPGFFSLSPSTR